MASSPSKPEVVQVSPLMADVQCRLEDTYQVHKLWLAPNRQELLARVAPNVRALVTSGSHGADAALIGALPRVAVITVHGVGYDQIDLTAAAARKLAITTTVGVLTADVADMAIALLFALSRRIAEGDGFVRRGAWARNEKMPLARRVTGKRAGIVGLGQVGSAIAHRLEAFEVSIAYVDPAPRANPYRRCASVAELAGSVDFLIAAAAGGAQTARIIDGPVLAALGPEGIFINVARGSLVDESALLAALENKRIAGAGLDVFESEPKIADRFIALPNVVLTPHQASATTETRMAMGQSVLDNLAAFYAGKPLLTPLAYSA